MLKDDVQTIPQHLSIDPRIDQRLFQNLIKIEGIYKSRSNVNSELSFKTTAVFVKNYYVKEISICSIAKCLYQ